MSYNPRLVTYELRPRKVMKPFILLKFMQRIITFSAAPSPPPV